MKMAVVSLVVGTVVAEDYGRPVWMSDSLGAKEGDVSR